MAEAATIIDLRTLLGDNDADNEVWGDTQLGLFIDEGYSEYTYGERTEANGTKDDRTQALKLAKARAYEELHSNTALFFKWKDQSKEVDRTMTPDTCRLMAKDLWTQVMAHRTALQNRTGVLDANRAQGTNMQMTEPGRHPPRTWY